MRHIPHGVSIGAVAASAATAASDAIFAHDHPTMIMARDANFELLFSLLEGATAASAASSAAGTASASASASASVSSSASASAEEEEQVNDIFCDPSRVTVAMDVATKAWRLLLLLPTNKKLSAELLGLAEEVTFLFLVMLSMAIMFFVT